MRGIVRTSDSKSKVIGRSKDTAKAWVNFNGTSTVAIRDDYGISSITDGGTGIYWAVFETAMPNVNYAWASTVGEWDRLISSAPPTTTHVVAYCIEWDDKSYHDDDYVTIIVFDD